MKTQHSPGPWHLKGHVVCADIPSGVVSVETPVADVCTTGSQLWYYEEMANAKLIAASPDMLNALIDAREILKDWGIDEEAAGHALLYRIESIIKKATE